MNYYHQKRHREWYLEQLAAFKKSESFLESEAFKLKGEAALVWLGNDGSARMDEAAVPERFYKVIMSWSDWKRKNCSETDEYIYNTWVESQKEAFKQTPEYRESRLTKFIYSSAYNGEELPGFDGIEVYENGTIELCTGEKFVNVVMSFDGFQKLKERQEQYSIAI